MMESVLVPFLEVARWPRPMTLSSPLRQSLSLVGDLGSDQSQNLLAMGDKMADPLHDRRVERHFLPLHPLPVMGLS